VRHGVAPATVGNQRFSAIGVRRYAADGATAFGFPNSSNALRVETGVSRRAVNATAQALDSAQESAECCSRHRRTRSRVCFRRSSGVVLSPRTRLNRLISRDKSTSALHSPSLRTPLASLARNRVRRRLSSANQFWRTTSAALRAAALASASICLV
jgi:hypothetical protein